MNISQDIKPVTYLKSRAADLLKQINETHRPVIITQNGEPKAILQDPKSYENMRNTIGILKLISQGEDEIRSGNSRSQQEVFENIENFLKDILRISYWKGSQIQRFKQEIQSSFPGRNSRRRKSHPTRRRQDRTDWEWNIFPL